MHPRQLSEGLAELARANDQKRDAALLRATTELFVLDVTHDRDEIRRYEELASHFLPKVSEGDRTFVAERLAMCPDAPSSIARMLARDVIAVAAPVLRHSRSLSTVDLLTVIATTGPEHHAVLAKRDPLPTEVARALRIKWDQGMPDASIADHEPRLRPPPSSVAEGKQNPWNFLALDRADRLRVIADIAASPPSTSGSAEQRLDRAFRSILSAAQIVSYARSGQLGAIIGSAADGLQVPSDLVAAAMNDPGGELLAILLKALRLDEAQAGQVFLLASPSGRDVNTFFPLADLYAGMDGYVADALIDVWRAGGTRRAQTGHQPQVATDTQKTRGERIPLAPKIDSAFRDALARRA